MIFDFQPTRGAIALALAGAALFLPNSVAAQSRGEGVLGWMWDGTYYATADEACRAQWEGVGMNNGYSRFIGALDRPNSKPWVKNCSWTSYQYLCPAETGGGIVSCWTILPSITSLSCKSGYARTAALECVREDEITAQRDICSYSQGSVPNPATPNPIILRDGTKYLTATDFVSGDGRMKIERTYRSLQMSTAEAAAQLPAGLSTGWQLNLMPELHLNMASSGSVSVIAGDGSTHDFVHSGGAWVTPNAADRSTDIQLEYVGTVPSPLTQIQQSESIWTVRDRDQRTWTFKTVPARGLSTHIVGLPVQMVEADGYTLTYAYNPDHSLQSISDGFGKTITFTWRMFYRTALSGVSGAEPISEAIAQIALPDQSTIRFTYDPPAALTPPSTARAERLVKVERLNAANVVVEAKTYHHEDSRFASFITGVTDHRGLRVATYEYDEFGRAIASEGANGEDRHEVEYTNSSTLLERRVVNPLGKAAVYRFAKQSSGLPRARLMEIEGEASANCAASATEYTYDTNNFRASETDAEGRVTTFTNDNRGRPLSVTRGSGTPAASTTTYAWHATFNLPTQVVQPGLTIDYVYDTTGRLTSLTQTDTTTHTLPFSTNGRVRNWTFGYSGPLLTSVDGPLAGPSDTTSYTYNSDGYLQTITNELGHVTTVTAWNGRGQPLSVTDANGIVTTYAYDDMGRVTAIVVEPGWSQQAWAMTYTAAGDLATLTEPMGAVYTFTWNDARRLAAIENNLGERVEYTHDAMGNVTLTEVKATGGSVEFKNDSTFDELGRLIAQAGYVSRTWTYAYDRTDKLAGITDPRQNTMSLGYDAVGRLVQETERDGGVTTRAYNAKDEETTHTDPRNLATTYVRNGFGEVIRETSPDRGITTYDHDARGLLTTRTDARGITTSYTYDAAGRLTARTYADTSLNVAFTYDSTAGGNNGIGRLTGMSDASGTSSYVYDAKGRVTQETRVIQGKSYVTSYQYGGAGQLWSVTYPSGHIVNYDYDALGRPIYVGWRVIGSAAMQNVVNWSGYLPYGGLRGINFASGLSMWQNYDWEYRIDGLYLTPQGGVSPSLIERYHWVGDGESITILNNDNIDPALRQNFAYDAAGRLASAQGPYGSLAWTYDALGNRTGQTKVTGGVTTNETYTYPTGSNRLSSIVSNGVTNRSFGYDAAGNLTSDAQGGTTKTYTISQAGRLSALSVNGTARASYLYDGRERLAVRSLTNGTPSGTTHLIHDHADRLIAEADGATGQVVRQYIWLGDMPVAVLDGSVNPANPTLYYVHSDHLNRPEMMTDGAQNIVWQAIYEPFGAVHQITGPAANDQRLPGQWFQLESGLSYNWHRHYDASLGRYTQPDTLGLIDGPSVYGYAGQSPVMWTDPTGEQRRSAGPSYAPGAGLWSNLYQQNMNQIRRYDPSYAEIQPRGFSPRPSDVTRLEEHLRRLQSGAAPQGGVYGLVNQQGGICYVGRSNDMMRRGREHERDDRFTGLRARPIFETNDPLQQRGMEQRAMDAFNPPMNRINGLSPRNRQMDAISESVGGFQLPRSLK